MEEWKIFTQDTNYEISNFGQVRAIGSVSYRKPRFDNHGYLRVNLRNEKTYHIHRMVAQEFLEPDITRTFVNHKNNVPWDNRINNLEWCTHSENMLHSVKIGAHYRGEHIHTVKLTEEQAKHIKYIDKRSSTEIAKELGVNRSTIGKIRRGISWKHI